MVEKLNAKTMISKMAGFLFIIFLIFILPPPSVPFLIIALLVAFLTMLLMVISLKQRNAKLYLIYHIGTLTIFFVMGLRCWDISIGMSWIMFICLIPGLALASLLPFINVGLSERLNAAQWLSGSGNLLSLALFGLVNIIFILILWLLFGVVDVRNIHLTLFVVLGFLFYLIQLLGMQSAFHTYANGNLQNWLNGKSGAAVR